MNKKKNIVIAITIVITLIEFVILFLFKTNKLLSLLLDEDNQILEILSLIMPTGLLYILNYYVLSPAIYLFFCTFWRILGHYEYLKDYYSKIMKACINWLINTDKHWGPLDTSSECQNANSCEGLLALKKSNLYINKSEIYKDAFKEVINNLTEHGLESKSLKKPTVVCTSMILYLAALEHDDMGIITDDSKLQNLSKYLWSIRGERGWGVYMMKMSNEYCCIANTFWALRALNKYSVGKTTEFKKYIKMMYEYANQSKFGFVIGDQPRLVTTAMAISLYYKLDLNTRNSIDKSFNVKNAINYVFDSFVIKGIQIEVETLTGIDIETQGAKKVPWNHISIGYAIEALNLAYLNNDLGVVKMDLFIRRIKKICRLNLKYVNSEQCYYIPDKMEFNRNGIYTFPTTYLIWGLSSFDY